ncbi:MAG: phospholipid carrier-dependent glycosyltransferase [Planctomycetota bacterium]|nr:phospholipid carrier-dependent glycosyltransferase [Planctomycetota bacterium]
MRGTNYRWLLAALFAAGILRGFFLLWFFGDLQQDPDGYRQIAENVANHGVYGQTFDVALQPTAYRPPLYPLLISLFVTEGGETDRRDPGGTAAADLQLDLASVALLHYWLSLLSVYFSFFLANRCGLFRFHAFAVAMVVALDPIGIRQGSLVMTETLAVFFATAGLFLLRSFFTSACRPGGALVCGVFLGLCALCRPTFLIWGGLIFLLSFCLGLRNRSEADRQRTRCSLVMLVGILLPLVPWIIRNQVVIGKPVFATSHGGYTIYLGNNDRFYDYLRAGKPGTWDGEKELRETVLEIRKASRRVVPAGAGQIDEVHKDRMYYDRAMETIRRRPVDFAISCLTRVIRFWSIFPAAPASSESSPTSGLLLRVGVISWYGVVFLLASIGLVRIFLYGRKNPDSLQRFLRGSLPAVLLVIAFQGLHLVYWSNMRMRAPLVVVTALLAVISWQKIGEWNSCSERTKEKGK